MSSITRTLWKAEIIQVLLQAVVFKPGKAGENAKRWDVLLARGQIQFRLCGIS